MEKNRREIEGKKSIFGGSHTLDTCKKGVTNSQKWTTAIPKLKKTKGKQWKKGSAL